MKKSEFFYLKYSFLVVKFSVYLNRHVFVMEPFYPLSSKLNSSIFVLEQIHLFKIECFATNHKRLTDLFYYERSNLDLPYLKKKFMFCM